VLVSAFDVSAFTGCHNGRRVYSNAVAATILRRRYPLDPPPQGLRRDMANNRNATPLPPSSDDPSRGRPSDWTTADKPFGWWSAERKLPITSHAAFLALQLLKASYGTSSTKASSMDGDEVIFYRRPSNPQPVNRSRYETSFLIRSATKCRVKPDFGFLGKGSASGRAKLEKEKKATMEVRLFLR
jgi:hypothetical protein